MIGTIVTIVQWIIDLIPFLKRKRLLVIDDNGADRELIKASCEDLGMACATAESAEIAFAMIRANRYTLMLVDFRLGGITGWQLIKRARGTFPTLKCCLMVGSVQSLLQLEPGIEVHIVTKPSDGNWGEILKHLIK